MPEKLFVNSLIPLFKDYAFSISKNLLDGDLVKRREKFYPFHPSLSPL